MSAKTVFVFCAQVLLIQLTFGQAIYSSGSTLSNAIDNTVANVIASGTGAAVTNTGFGVAGKGLGVAGSGLGLASSGLGLTGLGLANTGFGMANANLVNNAVVGNVDLIPNPAYLTIASLATSGGVLPVTSYSPLVPVGLTVVSDNAIEGQVTVNGQLPFLSAVAFEGSMSSDGAGSTSCGCGDGPIGIISESFMPAAAPALGGFGGLGFNGLGRPGFGGRFM